MKERAAGRKGRKAARGAAVFAAMLYKDRKLFFSAAGILTILLPFLMAGALFLGGRSLELNRFLRPFPIAVVDEDRTVMSRSLVSQIRSVEMLSEVRLLEGEEEIPEALSEGMAGVLIIPKDYFYRMYRAEDCPARLILNREAGLSSILLNSMMQSVMQIILGSESCAFGAFRWMYGPKLTGLQQSEMFELHATLLLRHALARQGVFDGEGSGSAIAEEGSALLRRVLSVVLPVILFGFSLMAVKTLPEERSLGISARLEAIGGTAWGMAVSKFIVVLGASLPMLILVLPILPGESRRFGTLLFLLIAASAFSEAWFLCALCGSPARTQRSGALLLCLSVLLSGRLWPCGGGTAVSEGLARQTLPYITGKGLEASAMRLSAGEFLQLCVPLCLRPVLFCAGALLLTGRGGALTRHRRKAHLSGSSPFTPDRWKANDFRGTGMYLAGSEGTVHGMAGRLAGLTALKLRNIGGHRGWVPLLAAISLLTGILSGAGTGGESRVRIILQNQDTSREAEELAQSLEDTEGLTVIPVSAAAARLSMLTEDAEGLLIIPAGYGAGMEKLRYESAAGAVTGRSVREIVAGTAAAQQIFREVVDDVEEREGRTLSASEQHSLEEAVREEREGLLLPIRTETGTGRAAADPFRPEASSFLWFFLMALGLLLGDFSCSTESRQAGLRMAVLPGGRRLFLLSDLLALCLTCWISGAGFHAGTAVISTFGENISADPVQLFPAGDWLRGIAVTALYGICVSLLGLLLAELAAAEGRIDGLSCFLAVLLCALGGCFLDPGILSPAFSRLLLLFPPGAARAAFRGQSAGVCALAAEASLYGIIYAAERLRAMSHPGKQKRVSRSYYREYRTRSNT